MFIEIKSENELKEFLDKIDYFHDGVLHSISYTSGSYGDKDGIFPNDNTRELIVTIQGCNCGEILLKFVGIKQCEIIPTLNNETSEIYQSNIQIIDNTFIYAQDVDDINDKIKLTKRNKTTIVSKELFYKIKPY